MKRFTIISIFTVLFALGSCRTSQSNMPAQLLTGTSWQVTELNGVAINPESYKRQAPYITFDGSNRISGSSGCNGFSGSYNLNDEGGMNVSQVAATKMFCEGVDEKGFF